MARVRSRRCYSHTFRKYLHTRCVEIADLLAQSRAAHFRKKQSAGRADRAGQVTTPPNYVTTESHIKDALLYRIQAEVLDPQHEDTTAWYTDQVEAKAASDSLLRFYVSYLSTDRYSSAWDEALQAMSNHERARLVALAGVAL